MPAVDVVEIPVDQDSVTKEVPKEVVDFSPAAPDPAPTLVGIQVEQTPKS